MDNAEQMDTQEALQIAALTGLTPHLRELFKSKVASMTLQQLALFLLHDELSPDDIRAQVLRALEQQNFSIKDYTAVLTRTI